MYDLYIANKNYSSWSIRPWILMKELEVPFKETLKPFQSDNYVEFKKFSPSAKVPCLKDGDTVIWDSLAIIEYLAEKHPNLWPRDAKARAWARCAAAEMHAGFFKLRNYCSMNCSIQVKLNAFALQEIAKDFSRIEELWSEGLKTFKGRFLAGDSFTAVDAFFVPVVLRNKTYNFFSSEFAKNYCNFILELDSVKNLISEAIKEPWIEPSHEEECLKHGTLLEDLRSKANK